MLLKNQRLPAPESLSPTGILKSASRLPWRSDFWCAEDTTSSLPFEYQNLCFAGWKSGIGAALRGQVQLRVHPLVSTLVIGDTR